MSKLRTLRSLMARLARRVRPTSYRGGMRVSPGRPFVIWTLQRTGGTNLASRLTQRSGLPCLEHEPFNSGCVYGGVADRWSEDADEVALSAAVSDIVAGSVPIKHCVEMVPWEVTHALAVAAAGTGYGHLFLYRRNPLKRLLSLHFATLSGVWGPERPRPADLAERVFAHPLPVAELVAHERRCASLLNRTWQLLRESGARPMALAYEDIYQADPDALYGRLRLVLDALGLSRGEADDRAFAAQVLGGGDQYTRNLYAAFQGIALLEQGLAGTERFAPDQPAADSARNGQSGQI